MPMTSPQLFEPGQQLITPAAAELLQQLNIDPQQLMHRHLAGDYGDLDEQDRQQNQAAIADGRRMVLSAYNVADDASVWIITAADRTHTTVLLPCDY
jgi:hypothetical protein